MLILLQIVVSQKKAQSDVLQTRRKLQHATSGVSIAFIYSFFMTRELATYTLLGSSVFVFSMHRLRLWSPALNKALIKQFLPILRPHEHHSLPGAFYVLVGTKLEPVP